MKGERNQTKDKRIFNDTLSSKKMQCFYILSSSFHYIVAEKEMQQGYQTKEFE